MAWLGTWAKRVKITIDQTDIDAALSDFPFLVYISTSSGRNGDDVSFVFDELQNDANRKKIAVTLGEDTECYVEIEKWDDANEEAWLWVKVPSVSSGADTELYLYYDSDHADNDTYVANTNSVVAQSVWDSDFKLVCHMRDDPDTSHVRDSTSNNNDGTKLAAGQPAVTTSGQIADAQDFDGDDDVINCGRDASLNNINAAITIEALVKPHTGYTPDDVSGICNKWNGRLQIWINPPTGVATLRLRIGAADKDVSFGVVPENDWSYLAGTYITGSQIAYLDGSLVNETAPTGDIDDHSASNLEIGRYSGGRNHDGLIDEFRVSNTNRNAAWIKATKESLWDDLLAFGSEEILVLAEASGSGIGTSIATGILVKLGLAAGSGIGIALAEGEVWFCKSTRVEPSHLEVARLKASRLEPVRLKSSRLPLCQETRRS